MSTISTSESADSEKPIVGDFAKIGRDLKLSSTIVEHAIRLLDEGNTIPFITRFRKDLTEGLDEKHLVEIKRAVSIHRALAERKAFILKSVESQGVLTEELKSQISNAQNLRALEDIYLPFKPQKQSRALIAKQQGLEALMEEILSATSGDIDLASRATHFVRVDKGLNSVDDVIRGVGDLLIERFSANPELKNTIRQIVRKTGKLVSKSIEEVQETKSDSKPGRVESTSAALPAVETTIASQVPLENETPFLETIGEVSTESTPLIESVEEVATSVMEAAVPSETVAFVPGETTPAELNSAMAEPSAASAKAETKKPRKKKKKKASPSPFKDYADFKQPLNKLSHHQYLATSRGERAGKLKLRIQADEEQVNQSLVTTLVAAEHPFAEFLKKSAQEALTKVLMPSIEREIRRELTEAAEKQATEVFSNNLRNLLLQPPLRNGKVLAIDPGFKSGCGAVVLDELGNVVEHGQVFVVGNQIKRDESKAKIVEWAKRHHVRLIAIGSGAACRQAEQMVSDLIAESLSDSNIRYVMVNEAGASVYSISETGREELPELSPAIRSAVSIGRRLQDPLSEFVKISPPNIGVGMYQHDVKAKHLVDSLDEVVESCVNQVGVNVNTASVSLLKYVSGLNSLAARRLVEHRQKIGGFKNRQQLKEVSGIGEATFVQAAGFLRIHDGENPLDATAIHPESYALAESIMNLAQTSLQELFPVMRNALAGSHGNVASAIPVDTNPEVSESTSEAVTAVSQADHVEASEPQVASDVAPEPSRDPELSQKLEARKQAIQRLSQLNIDEVAQKFGAGKMLVRDIILALKKPTWDPRDRIAKPIFRSGILKIDDLKPDMQLDGQVVNVVDFGVFIDIGLGESSLVHVSQLSNRFIADPQRLYSVGDILRVWVSEVDAARRRVKLTAVNPQSRNLESKSKPRFKRGERSANSSVSQTETAAPAKDAKESRFSSKAKSGKFGTRPSVQRRDDRKEGQGKSYPPRDSKSNFEHRGKRDQTRPHTRKPQPVQPAPPITEGMLKGNEPMRSFSDLLQFVRQKPKNEVGEA